MVEKLQKLQVIAKAVGAEDLFNKLHRIEYALSSPNANLVFPLVGEFASGKTSLINALTDFKKLETGIKPTTATIYFVHFGCEKYAASVVTKKGEKVAVTDIESLKNEDLAETDEVHIYDTSTLIPSSTILVDTPGLSSQDPRHRQALVNVLPQADGILLVMDINQQITRSLTDFIEMMQLSNRSIYLVVTKCDTKAPVEAEKSKKYIRENLSFQLDKMACVSAEKGDVNELNAIIDDMQERKNDILLRVNTQRVENIRAELITRIDILLQSSQSEDELDKAIEKQRGTLSQLKSQIKKIVDEQKDAIERKKCEICRGFEDKIAVKLNNLVAERGVDFDNQAINLINGTATLLINTFKNDIAMILRDNVRKLEEENPTIRCHSLLQIDMSDLNSHDIPYIMNLNSAGHEYDSFITKATKVGITIGTMYAGGDLTAIGNDEHLPVDDIIETTCEVVTSPSDSLNGLGVQNVMQTMQQDTIQYQQVENANQQIGQQIGVNKGIIESVVELVTDRTMGRPQRKRAVNTYMDNVLMPRFKQEMNEMQDLLVTRIKDNLQQEAQEDIDQMCNALEALKVQRREKQDAFEEKCKQLKGYKQELELLTI